MDYTVGSLADLISGKNTSNRTKVLTVPFKGNNDKLNGKKTSSKVKNKKEQPLVKISARGNKSKKRKNSIAFEEEPVVKKLKSKLKSPASIEVEPVLKKVKKKSKSSISLKEEPFTKKELKSSSSLEDEPAPKKVKNKSKSSSTKKKHSLADSEDENEANQETENVEIEIKKNKTKVLPHPEILERTIFVGNVPINTKKKKMKQLFKKYGEIECLRFRGIPVADPKMTKKVAAIKSQFHPDRKSILCYIRFVNKEDALEAIKEDGSIFEEHHLHVESCSNKEKHDESKAIFIGNLNFSAEEDELWNLFEPCGPISSVRIVRDSYTGMGKGFAYVNFKDADAVQLALEMENVKLGNRELRIKLSCSHTAKKMKKNKANVYSEKASPNIKNNQGAFRRKNMKKGQGQVSETASTNIKNNESSFQGFKFTANKKKHKVNKGALDKKRKIKKIAPF